MLSYSMTGVMNMEEFTVLTHCRKSMKLIIGILFIGIITPFHTFNLLNLIKL